MEQRKYSFLHSIEDFIKMEGIPFKKIPLPTDILDETVVANISSIFEVNGESNYYLRENNWFYIGFDNNDSIFLEFPNSRASRSLFVIPDDVVLSGSYRGIKSTETRFCEYVDSIQRGRVNDLIEQHPYLARFLRNEEDVYRIEYYLDDWLLSMFDYIKYLDNEYKQSLPVARVLTKREG